MLLTSVIAAFWALISLLAGLDFCVGFAGGSDSTIAGGGIFLSIPVDVDVEVTLLLLLLYDDKGKGGG